MDAVLTQDGHPISFFSKQFCPKLLNSSRYVRQLHAITSIVQNWRHLPLKAIYYWNWSKVFKNSWTRLYGYLISIITYQNNLKMIILLCLNRVKLTRWHMRYQEEILHLNSQLFILTLPSFDLLNALSCENKSLSDLQALVNRWNNKTITIQFSPSTTAYSTLREIHFWLKIHHRKSFFCRNIMTNRRPSGNTQNI